MNTEIGSLRKYQNCIVWNIRISSIILEYYNTLINSTLIILYVCEEAIYAKQHGECGTWVCCMETSNIWIELKHHQHKDGILYDHLQWKAGYFLFKLFPLHPRWKCQILLQGGYLSIFLFYIWHVSLILGCVIKLYLSITTILAVKF